MLFIALEIDGMLHEIRPEDIHEQEIGEQQREHPAEAHSTSLVLLNRS
jgi:hypothetical protein